MSEKKDLKLTKERIAGYIENKNLMAIKEELMDLNEVEIAELLDEVDPKTTYQPFRSRLRHILYRCSW